MVFNNLVCARLPLQGPSQAPAPAPSSSQQYIAAPMMANASIPSPIYIEYAPVVYLHNQPSSGSDEWQSDLNSLITFLVRCGDVSTPCMYFPKFAAFHHTASVQTLNVPGCIHQLLKCNVVCQRRRTAPCCQQALQCMRHCMCCLCRGKQLRLGAGWQMWGPVPASTQRMWPSSTGSTAPWISRMLQTPFLSSPWTVWMLPQVPPDPCNPASARSCPTVSIYWHLCSMDVSG